MFLLVYLNAALGNNILIKTKGGSILYGNKNTWNNTCFVWIRHDSCTIIPLVGDNRSFFYGSRRYFSYIKKMLKKLP